MPGMTLNLFFGFFALVLNLYLLFCWPQHEDDFERLSTFVKTFLTVYSTAALVFIAVVAARLRDRSERFEWVMTWAVAIATPTFVCALQWLLQVPFGNSSWWSWVVYAVVCAFLMVYSIFVSRVLPMMLGCFSTCFLLWHLATSAADLLGLEGALVRLLILALLGIGVFVMAVQYGKYRDGLESSVRRLLLWYSRGLSDINDGSGGVDMRGLDADVEAE